MAVFHAFYIVQMVPNCAKHHKQTVTAKKAEIKKQGQNKKKEKKRKSEKCFSCIVNGALQLHMLLFMFQ